MICTKYSQKAFINIQKSNIPWNLIQLNLKANQNLFIYEFNNKTIIVRRNSIGHYLGLESSEVIKVY